MKRLEQILVLLKDPEWVTRPETDIGFESDMPPAEAEAMGQQVQPPAPAPRTVPLSANQLDVNLGATNAPEQTPEPSPAAISPARRRLMHAANMEQLSKQQTRRPLKTLAGGGYGSGIF